MTIEQEVRKYLDEQAAREGISPVRRACQSFLKQRTIPGVTPTRRPSGEVPKPWTEAAFIRQGLKCNRCRGEFKLSEMEGDHIKPLIQGGEHVKKNIQALCPPCNKEKGSTDPITDAKRRGTVLNTSGFTGEENEI